ncbi:MAG: hypothetical protein DRJ60_00085 [Thermoprotei archaeon]|nr:MAG: hypothetical protein DRJ60_00085 [Thermoprotei archaeon]
MLKLEITEEGIQFKHVVGGRYRAGFIPWASFEKLNEVKARKPLKCFLCNTTIRKGEIYYGYYYSTKSWHCGPASKKGHYQRDFVAIRLCKQCYNMIKNKIGA